VIEKRPYWQDPSIEAQESKLVEEGKVAKFSPLTELPIAFSSWGYDTPMDAAPVFCTYQFSDGTSEKFLLSYYRNSPDGQLMLKLMVTDPNDEECSNNFSLLKVKSDCYVLTHHYAEPEFRSNPEDEDDWEYNAIRAGVETFGASFTSNENFAREDAINNSPFKDLYLKAVATRNALVGELMFDRTFSEVFRNLTKLLPLYVKSTTYAPSYKTGKTFERYFFLDNPTDREITRGSIYFGPEYDIAKEDIVIFQAGLHNGKNLSFRNQPVARIQRNGEITWQSFESKQIFSLEVRDFLQELMGDKSEVVNREINEAAMMNGPLFTADVAKQLVQAQGSIIYDKNSDYGGDLLIIKAEPEVLATNFVAMLRSNFGFTQQGIQPVTHPNLPDYYSDCNFKFELFADVDLIFTKSFYKALSSTSN
jgi:hypothetical protein